MSWISTIRAFSAFGSLLIAGCAVQHYQAAPITPSATALILESRSLSDPGLRSFIEKNLGHPMEKWPPAQWNLNTLTLAALYFNPTMESARDRVVAAQAAIVTAGERPNPVLDVSPGVPSPYLLTLDLAIPIETKGKRGYRVEAARSLDQAAEFDLADTAWKVRSGVRAALLDYLLTSRILSQLHSEQQVRAQQIVLLQARFDVGEIPRPELDLARIDQSKNILAISAAEGQFDHAKAALAASVGVPVIALRDVQFSWPEFDSPPSVESLSVTQIRHEALLNRVDIRSVLAQYSAAEANLQLEIARQYPDISIGPGYTYEEGNGFFAPAASLVLPIFNRNQGPIAEAEAARKQAASALVEKQAQVIAESEQALAVYTAALKEFTEANESLRQLQDEQEQRATRAVHAGEEDRLSLNGVQIESSVIAGARLDALSRTMTALGALEDAVQQPLGPGEGGPLPDGFAENGCGAPDATAKESTR